MVRTVELANKENSYSENNELEKILLFYLAPVLKGIKPAELIILNKQTLMEQWEKKKCEIMMVTELFCKELVCSKNKICLLFYNENMLSNYLEHKNCRYILRKNGYSNLGVLKELLEELAEKMKTCVCPHEIGVFLGYPAHDVEAFIKFKGKEFAICKHWKVYVDMEKAELKFLQIDEARSYAQKLLKLNVPFQNTVKMIKAI